MCKELWTLWIYARNKIQIVVIIIITKLEETVMDKFTAY